MQSVAATLKHVHIKFKAPWHEVLFARWPQASSPWTQHVRIERLEPHRIVLGVYNPRWLHELKQQGLTLFERIRTVVPEIPEQVQVLWVWARDQRETMRVRRSRAPQIQERQDMLVVLTHQEQSALERLTDPELRAQCLAYWQKCQEEHRVTSVEEYL